MDPYSPEGELYVLHNEYHQGQYSNVAEYDFSSASSENQLAARVLVLRARIALGQADRVLAEVSDESDVPELSAVAAFARFMSGDHSAALEAVNRLVESDADNPAVQVLCGTVLHGLDQVDDALALLAKHERNLEAVALITQIYLQQSQTELATKEVNMARQWAQDSVLVNLAEAWVGLRVGGEKYQQAYYVFEELAQAASTSANKTLVGQAVAELHLGRLPEAEAALEQAKGNDRGDAFVLANSIVCSTLSGKDPTEAISSLRSVAPDHPLLQDLAEKSSEFDAAAAMHTPRVAARG